MSTNNTTNSSTNTTTPSSEQQTTSSNSSNSTTTTDPHARKLQDNLGASTWAFMHTVAAQYPKKPSSQQQSHIKQLFYRIAEFYPCRWCAKDFAESIQKYPIQSQSREALSIWLCERHNEVNEKIGKPIVPDCSTAWKKWLVEDDQDDSAMVGFDEDEKQNNDDDLKWLSNTNEKDDAGIDFQPPSMDDLMKDCKFCEGTMGKERYEKMKTLFKKP